MIKRADSSNARRARRVMLGIILAGSVIPIAARAGTVFTWDPAAVSPPLGGPFTADAMVGGHYLRDVEPIADPSPVIYTVSFIEQIDGFRRNGAPVATPGLNGAPGAAGSYGLYVTLSAQTLKPGPPGTRRYLGGTMTLMLDPGNDNGALSSTLAGGLGFASGTANDITLATGSLVSGHFSMNPAPGIRSIGDFVETLQPAAGEGGFFVAPMSPDVLIEEVTTTLTSGNIAFVPDPSDPTMQVALLNGGTTVFDLQVAEPASLLLLGSGLIGLAVLRPRRNRRRPR